uniref:SAM domain-containing protein n=1 Tax=Neolamprologus brichardi TaxID=32507 RepID=A0A3Q4HGR5_NEOBR
MIISGTELWVSTEAYHCYPRSKDHFTSVVLPQFLSYAVIFVGSSRSPSPLTLMQAVAASGKPFASKPMELWSKHDVADWLESLNLGEHRDAFLDNEIEGAHLPSLQKEDLIDLGVTRVGHRMNIERALKLLQDRQAPR